MLHEINAEHSSGTPWYSPGVQDWGNLNDEVVVVGGEIVVVDAIGAADLVPQVTWFGQSHLPLLLLQNNPEPHCWTMIFLLAHL